MEGRGPASGDLGAEEIFEQLRADVRSQPPPPVNGRDPGTAWRTEREEAQRRWTVTAERPFQHLSGGTGGTRRLVLTPLKSTLRKLLRWYVEPPITDQRAFNASALRLLDQLAARVDAAMAALEATAAELSAAERRAAGHEDRIARLERRPAPALPAKAPAPAPSASSVPDYFAFEVRMRGATADVRERQRLYVADFGEAAPVLDVGCGRGEFLELLRDAGIEAKGVDSDGEMVTFARGAGLEVAHDDALRHLETLADGSLGGLFAAQFVEHLPPPALVRFLALAAAKLRRGGVCVLETINPASLVALRHYFADLTHAQPLVAETLTELVRQAGFAQTEVRYVNEPPAAARLQPVELPPDPAFDAAREALAADVARLNEVVFGPQDYAVVALR